MKWGNIVKLRKLKTLVMKDLMKYVDNTNLLIGRHYLKKIAERIPQKRHGEAYYAFASLEGDGLLHIQTASDCEDTFNLYAVKLTKFGVGYFDRIHDEKMSAIRNWTANAGLAVFGAVLGWLLSVLTMFLTGQLEL